MSETKTVTGKVRFSYAHVFEPTAVEEGAEKFYNICVMVSKKDKATIAKLEKAIEAAVESGIKGKWGGARPKKLKLPLRDADDEKEGPEWEGVMFFNTKSKKKPQVVDQDLNPIIDPEEFYSGCYGRVSINFYPYDYNGSKGVAAGLNNIQKLEDGERLDGGGSSAEEDFSEDLF
jgi:hypothetical protein